MDAHRLLAFQNDDIRSKYRTLLYYQKEIGHFLTTTENVIAVVYPSLRESIDKEKTNQDNATALTGTPSFHRVSDYHHYLYLGTYRPGMGFPDGSRGKEPAGDVRYGFDP